MFRTISDLPRSKAQWEATASGIHNDASSDFIRKMDACRDQHQLLARHGSRRPRMYRRGHAPTVGPISRTVSAIRCICARLARPCSCSPMATIRPAGSVRRSFSMQGDWKVMLRTDSPSGPSAGKRVLHRKPSPKGAMS